MRAFEIISTTPFRRLAAKQQVFGLIGDDHSRTRYSHSIETAAIGRRLIERLDPSLKLAAYAADTLEAACLLHDIGMPPFGHKGEAHIRAWVQQEQASLAAFGAQAYQEYAAFDSNAQGLRLVYYHPQFMSLQQPGAAAIIAASVKYPHMRDGLEAGKCGVFSSEIESYRKTSQYAGLKEVDNGVFERHPLSYVLEVADDIAYLSADIEDAGRLSMISMKEFESLFETLIAQPEQPMNFYSPGHRLWSFRCQLVEQLITLFAQCAMRYPGADMLPLAARDFFQEPMVQRLKRSSVQYIYQRRDILDKISSQVIHMLLQQIFIKIIEQGSDHPAIQQVVHRFLNKRPQLKQRSSPLQLTIDIISEFSDNFAMALYQSVSN